MNVWKVCWFNSHVMTWAWRDVISIKHKRARAVCKWGDVTGPCSVNQMQQQKLQFIDWPNLNSALISSSNFTPERASYVFQMAHNVADRNATVPRILVVYSAQMQEGRRKRQVLLAWSPLKALGWSCRGTCKGFGIDKDPSTRADRVLPIWWYRWPHPLLWTASRRPQLRWNCSRWFTLMLYTSTKENFPLSSN